MINAARRKIARHGASPRVRRWPGLAKACIAHNEKESSAEHAENAEKKENVHRLHRLTQIQKAPHDGIGASSFVAFFAAPNPELRTPNSFLFPPCSPWLAVFAV
ncbi:MAG: hypothetical protein JO015_13780 [Verrucomicrobia bacterium]|nr:hypothetical protein [Verrucomicrobiota bacterium]